MNSQDTLKIALALSGGGYRAASFSLGMLTYLSMVKINSGQSLLDCVCVLSTVSGGSITGARYAIGISNNEDFDFIYKDLYENLKNKDLVNLSLDQLSLDKPWKQGRVKSIICAFADVYDKYFFNQRKFADLLDEDKPIHLKHISFNAVEFSNALQFRFQQSERINDPSPNEGEKGYIGNFYFQIPEKAAKEIRIADIVAASSCFPGGFEPINFPSDFIYEGADELKKLGEKMELCWTDGWRCCRQPGNRACSSGQ